MFLATYTQSLIYYFLKRLSSRCFLLNSCYTTAKVTGKQLYQSVCVCVCVCVFVPFTSFIIPLDSGVGRFKIEYKRTKLNIQIECLSSSNLIDEISPNSELLGT